MLGYTVNHLTPKAPNAKLRIYRNLTSAQYQGNILGTCSETHRRNRKMKITSQEMNESTTILHSEETKKRTVKDYEHHFRRSRKLSYTMLVMLILSHFQCIGNASIAPYR